MKKILSLLTHRVVIVALCILVQLIVLVGMVLWFNDYFVYFYSFCLLLSGVSVMGILSGKSNPVYKLAWTIPILIFPIFGGLFYLMFGHNRESRRERGKMARITRRLQEVEASPLPPERLGRESRQASAQSRYISEASWCPLFQGTETEYLPSGEVAFERMKAGLEGAERYIFLEYFIIQEGVMWDSILEILVRKARAGVDVRVIYDDIGCMFTLPYGYRKTLEEMGIHCCVFSPFVPVLSSRFNNRDHRKITVIDGYVGFTGGINLADEYINAIEKHGHWKDTAVMLKGEAVWSLTVMFLSMWDFLRNEQEELEAFFPDPLRYPALEGDGFVQPFCDSPMDEEAVGENIYLNLINRAERYVYINTPYLIIDNEMVTALCLAAKSGVDVRIVTPYVADKWYVHAVTRSYYAQLIESGIKIYEYTPGFLHAKSFVVDDYCGVVGTVNLDYRSLYHHFECGVWMCGTSSLTALRDDYLETLEVCRPITLEACRSVAWYRRIGRSLLKIFAPLM